MVKRSFEFKMQVVNACKQGIGGYITLPNMYGVPDMEIIWNWVNAYNALTAEGLSISRQKNHYCLEFKLHIVELYLTWESPRKVPLEENTLLQTTTL